MAGVQPDVQSGASVAFMLRAIPLPQLPPVLRRTDCLAHGHLDHHHRHELAGLPAHRIGLLLGIVGFASQFPAFLLTPFAGIFVDRWNRHRLLVTSLHGVQFAPTPVLASLLADTDLSLIPALETTAARLKLESRLVSNGLSVASASRLAAVPTPVLAPPVTSAGVIGRHQAFPTILRR
jgi:MFS family permease